MSKRILSAAVVVALIAGAGRLAAADPVETLLDHAKQLKKDKKYDEALEFYAAVGKLDPKNVEALVQKAWLLNEASQYAEAIGAAEAAVKLDPKSSDAHTELGFAQHKTKKLLRAKESLEKAVKLDPGNMTAKGYLTAVLKDLGED